MRKHLLEEDQDKKERQRQETEGEFSCVLLAHSPPCDELHCKTLSLIVSQDTLKGLGRC